MECVNHPEQEPIGRCVTCGVLLCSDCAIERDKIYCAGCDPYAHAQNLLIEKEGLDVWRSLEYVFDDPRWLKKILTGGLVVFLSPLILPYFVLLGYMGEVVKAVARGRDCELPEWGSLKGKFELGARLIALRLVYLIPLLVVLAATSLIGIFGGEVVGNHLLEGLLLTLFTFGWLLACMVFILIKLTRPSFDGILATTGSLEKGLDVITVIHDVIERRSQYFIALAVSLLLVPLVMLSGFFFFFVGIFFTSFYALLISAHVTGQLSRRFEE